MKKILLLLLTFLTACIISHAQEWTPAGENIRTRWASSVSPDNCHTEYPRPQMVRPQWQNLNGLWDYAISPEDADSMPENADGQILVPFCVESSLSGVCKRISENEILWYRTSIVRPSTWDGKKILLHFDAVDWRAEVFIDGKQIASHTGGYTAFSVDVTDYLSDTPAELVVKVWDPTDDPKYSIPRGKQVSDPNGIWYTPVTGIWQSVWMEPVNADAHIEDYNVTTDIATGEISVTATCDGAESGDKIRVDILRPKIGYDTEKPGWSIFRKGRKTVAAGETATIKIRNPKLWSTDKPYLYGVKISLIRNGKVIDRIQGYTAMRKISGQRDSDGVKRWALNDKILFQIGPLDQGWWPDGLYTAPSSEALTWDIKATKDLGFNMIRKHIKVEPAQWYYACDRLGMMVWQDMPSIGYYNGRSQWGQGEDCYGAGTDYWARNESNMANYYKEWGEIIAQLKKFQSIVVWVPFNEAWGQFDSVRIGKEVERKDPTRTVDYHSGWLDQGEGSFRSLHVYFRPYVFHKDKKNRCVILSEFGGYGHKVQGHTWGDDTFEYKGFKSREELTEAVVDLYEKQIIPAVSKGLSASVYTQLSDVEDELNGLVTYDRKVVKMDKEKIRAMSDKLLGK